MSDDKRKRAGVAAVFWIVLALTLLIMFLVQQDNIVRILKDTEFFVHVFGEEPDFITNYDLPEREATPDDLDILAEEGSLTETRELIIPPLETPEQEQRVDEVIEEPQNIIVEAPVVESEAPPVQAVTSQQYLYFIFVNGDGTIERKESVRTISRTTAPLTAALKALLDGPNLDEKDKKYISFIPAGTQLLSVSIQDGTALVNFSEEFSFNQYGVEGYLAQLMQVVYTATAFNTIKDVRFLIEGEQSSYLGNDGVWIGAPLSRTDFKEPS